MVTTDLVPTLTIAKYAYGAATVRMLVRSHLYTLSQATGVTASADALDAIVDDILSGYGDLKVTELILALKMIREGKFRDGNDGSSNRGQFFGVLSSSVICDCLNRFRFDYRNPILARHEQEEERRRKDEEMSNAAKYDDYKVSIFRSILTSVPSKMGQLLSYFSRFIKNPQDMIEIKEYIDERARLYAQLKADEEELYALRLLKQRVEEHLNSSDLTDVTKLRKGIEYINTKFPSKSAK